MTLLDTPRLAGHRPDCPAHHGQPCDCSLAERAASLPADQRAELLAGYDDDALRALAWDWDFWARPDQLPPPEPWSIWAIVASGRGSGKTRAGAEWVRRKVRTLPPGREGVLIGATPADVRDLMVDGPSGIKRVTPPSEQPNWEPSKRLLTWPNGVVAHCRSGADPEGIRGLNLEFAWADEIVKWAYIEQAWDNLRLALREGDRPQTVITTTPKRLPLLRTILDGLIPGTVVAPRMSTYRNAANLASSFIDEMRATLEGTRMGRQELHGEYLELVEGALFSHEMIDADRWRGDWRQTDEGLYAPALPDMRRVAIGVDPSGSVNTEWGIIATGVGTDGEGYVLADYSRKGSPAECGKAVVRCAWDNDADVIVGERDYGGDMVRHIISQIPADDVYPAGSMFRYVDARARNVGPKKIRAENIVNLYELHHVHHVGMLADLEDEMVTWVPDEPGPSPNRLDALVWSLWVLMIGRPHKPGRGAARQIIDARIG